MVYQDIDIFISERRADGSYRVRVQSAVGVARGSLELDFSDPDFEQAIIAIGMKRSATLDANSPQAQAAREVGRQLFDDLFDELTFARFSSAMDQARLGGSGARIRLHMQDAPELAVLPWEYMYDAHADHFLALAANTPIIRFLQLPQPVTPHPTTQPLRILGVVSSPSDLPPLDIATEKKRLDEAVAQLATSGHEGMLEIEWVEKATVQAVRRALRRQEFHILHFIGHGIYDRERDEGALVFQDEQDESRYINASQLSTLLRDRSSLRLAVLNACEGARTGIADPFAGVSPALVRAGLPATVSMQYEVTDVAAITFAREFYGAIAEGMPIHTALTEARMAIFLSNNAVEWGTPVLYTHAEDGIIFRLPGSTTPATTRTTTATTTSSSGTSSSGAGASVNLSTTTSTRTADKPHPNGPQRSRLPLILGAIVALLLIGAFVVWRGLLQDTPAAPDPTPADVATVAPTAPPIPTATAVPPTPTTARPSSGMGESEDSTALETVVPTPITTPVAGHILFPSRTDVLWRYESDEGQLVRVRLMEQQEADGKISLVQITEVDDPNAGSTGREILRFRWFRWQDGRLTLFQEQLGQRRDPSIFSPPLPFLRAENVESWTWPITNETIIRGNGTRATAFINGNTELVGIESITVPAGDFPEAIHVRYNRIRIGATIENIATDMWLVPDVGVVRERTTINERVMEEFSLLEFTG